MKRRRCAVTKGADRGFRGWLVRCTCGYWQGWHEKAEAEQCLDRHVTQSDGCEKKDKS